MTVRGNCSGCSSSSARRPESPSTFAPLIVVPLASTGLPDSSTVRHPPMTSKFSSANPSGSIAEWQLLHTGFCRCCASRSRIVGGTAPGLVSEVVSTPGGGGGTTQAKDIVQQPFATEHRRRAVRIGRRRQQRRPADRGDDGDGRVGRGPAVRGDPIGRPVRRTEPHRVRRRARHALGAVSLRRIRRAAAPRHVGPGRRYRRGARRREARRDRQRRHDPGPRAVRRLPRRCQSGQRAGGRAR